MTNMEKIYGIIGQAQGTIAALYGVLRDMSSIGINVDDNKDGKLGDVVADTLNALSSIPDIIENM